MPPFRYYGIDKKLLRSFWGSKPFFQKGLGGVWGDAPISFFSENFDAFEKGDVAGGGDCYADFLGFGSLNKTLNTFVGQS